MKRSSEVVEGSVELIAKPTLEASFAFCFKAGMKALLVSSSKDLAQAGSLFLRVRWPELSLFSSVEAREVMELIYREEPEVVVLQYCVAPMDCFDLISQIRGFSSVPIIVLGQSDDVIDNLRALEMGADDWIAPSSIPMEFIAKVNAVLRCSLAYSNGRLACFLSDREGVDCATRKACVLGRQVKLTSIECKILCGLVRNEGRVVSCADLPHSVWGGQITELILSFLRSISIAFAVSWKMTILTPKSS